MDKMQLTKEQRKKYNHCHRLAQKHFGLLDVPPYSYVMHHKDETLVTTDIERYIEWRIEDLEVIPYGEHTRMHTKGNHWNKGRKNPGVSAAHKGKHWKVIDGKRVWLD